MKTLSLRIFLTFSFFSAYAFSQNIETIVNSDFTIRDFIINNDSVFFIKKRDVFFGKLGDESFRNYFIGGYGQGLFEIPQSDILISTSNELANMVSSVRFYNKNKKRIENVFYYRNGRIIDFLVIPEIYSFVLSLTNNKIVVINYEERPRFLKSIEIDISSKSRKLWFYDKKLFFATDDGGIYEYSFFDYKKRLILNCNDVVTDFYLTEDMIIYSTIKGLVVKRNRRNNKETKLKFDNNFILNSLEVEKNKKLICGSWNGIIYELDLEILSIKNEYKHHTKSVLNISSGENGVFYSCGLDRSIKKWELNSD